MYATVSQLKSEVGIASADTSQDTYLTDLLTRITAWIETYTHRKWSGSALTVSDEVHDFIDGNKVYLDNINIKSVTAVKIGQTQDGSPITLDPSAYRWSKSGRLVIYSFPYEWQTGLREESRDLYLDYVSVSYTHAGDGIPADIEAACIMIAARLYRNSAVRREKIGDYEIEFQRSTITDVLSIDELGVLDAHRTVHV